MRTRRTFALVALCLTVAVLAVGFASATHVNDESELPTTERTGIGFLDQFLDLVLGPVDSQIEEVNRETEDERSEPQVPAVFYHESYEDEPLPPRSWGEWAPLTDPNHASVDDGFEGWRLSQAAAANGETGIWFGDENGYPTPPGTQATNPGTVAWVGMVSPRINLSSLPVEDSGRDARAPQTVDTPAGPRTLQPDTGRAATTGSVGSETVDAPVTVGGREGTTPADRIMLSMQHRFNLAYDDQSGNQDLHLNDTAHVAVYPGGPPPGSHERKSPYDTFGVPTGVQTAVGVNSNMLQFHQNTSFMGSQDDFQESRFDLTQFAGQEIRLVFWMQIRPPANGDVQFTSDALFDTDAGFYGWQIDELLIEGPALPHNVLVDEVENPFVQADGEADRVAAPGEDQPPFSAVVINRGQFTENVTVNLELVRQEDGDEQTCGPKNFTDVPPGWTREVSFDCTRNETILREGTTYTATVRADPVADDAHEDDNAMTLDVKANRAPKLTATPLTVTPGVDDTDVPRTVKLTLRNQGNGFETAHVDLAVQRNVSGLAPEGEHWETVTENVTRGQESQRSVELAPRGSRTVTWGDVLLESAGTYRVFVNGTLDLEDFDPPGEHEPEEAAVSFSRETSAGTLVAQPPAYKTSFDIEQRSEAIPEGLLEDLSTEEARNRTLNWTARQLAPGEANPPPCPVQNESKCTPGNRTVWELPRFDGLGCLSVNPCSGRETWTLRGSVDAETATDVSQAGRQFEAFKVRLTHALTVPDPTEVQDHRVSLSLDGQGEFTRDLAGWAGGLDSGVTIGGSPPSDNVGVGRAADGFLQVYPMGGNPPTWNRSGHSEPSSRLAYHGGQWVTERFQVPAHSLVNRSHNISQISTGDASDVVEGLPPSALSELTLRLWAGSASGGCPKGNPPSVQPARTGGYDCSEWLVSEAEVLGVPAGADGDGSEEVPLIRWNGTGNERGEWDNQTTASSFAWGFPVTTLPKERRGVDCAFEEATGLDRPTPPDTGVDLVDGILQANSEFVDNQCLDGPWRERPVEDLGQWNVDPANTDPPIEASYADTVWQEDPTNGTWVSGDGPRQLGMLTSPALVMPGEANAPTLRFTHSYDFGHGDAGRLMVRVLGSPSDSGEDVEAALDDKPWLPVAKDWVESSLTQRFYNRTDHDDLSNGPELNGTQLSNSLDASFPGPHSHAYTGHSPEGQRPTENVPLDAFPLLNYSGLTSSLNGQQIGSLGDQDVEALRVIDLTEACDGPCLVQFGFRTETLENPNEGWTINGFQIGREEKTAHDLAAVNASLSAAYDWRDLTLGSGSEVTLSVNASNRGLFGQPPGGGTASIRVNATWLTENSNDEVDAQVAASRALEGVRLEPGENGTLVDDLSLTVPQQEGTYRLFVCVSLEGTLAGGRVHEDGDVTNNCLALGRVNALQPVGVQRDLKPSDMRDEDVFDQITRTLTVHDVQRLSLDLRVTPEVGVKGFARQVDLSVNNTGNVQPDLSPEDKELELRYRHFDNEDRGDNTFDLTEVPAPGESLPFERLLSDNVNLPGRFTPEEQGRYVVEALVEGPEFADTVDTRIENRNGLYVESFDRAPWGSLAREGRASPDAADTAWQKTTVRLPNGHEPAVWNFGDPLRSTYPAMETDQSLRLPPLDVSTAMSGSLAFTHRYQLEESFDGARVEYSLDGGDTWTPLEPAAGYPGTVAADNPMNPDDDPSREEPAWTGSSDGWQAEEFDLSRIDDLSSITRLEEFRVGNLEDPDAEPSEDKLVPPDRDENSWWTVGNVSLSPDGWHDEGLFSVSCGEESMFKDCWYRENGHLGEPAPDPGHGVGNDPKTSKDGEFWWMGAEPWWGDDRTHPDRYWTLLPLEFELPEQGEQGAEGASLSFWLWSGALDMDQLIPADSSGQPGCGEGLVPPTNPKTTRRCRHASFLHVFDAEKTPSLLSPWDNARDPAGGWNQLVDSGDVHFEEEAHGWTRWSVDLKDAMQDEKRTVRVEFLASRGWGSVDNSPAKDLLSYRGFAIDDVQLNVSESDGTNRFIAFDADDWGTVETACGEPEQTNCVVPSPQEDVPQEDVGWHLTKDTFAIDEAWTVEKGLEDRSNIPREAWVFGSNASNEPRFTYPVNARERLVTPIINLTKIGGSEASITFWEKRNFDRFDHGDDDQGLVQVQPIRREVGGQTAWVPTSWEEVDFEEGCEDEDIAADNAWCRRTVNLTDYIGQQVRLGFAARTDHDACDTAANDAAYPGCFWAVHDLQVDGELFVGDQLDLRLRAATDRSVGIGYWTVENLQLAGRTYEDNVAVIPDDDVTEERVAPGTNKTYEGTVRNLGGVGIRQALVLTATTERVDPGASGKADSDLALNLTLHGKGGNVTVDGEAALAVPLRDERSFRLNISVPEDPGVLGNEHRVSLNLVKYGGEVENLTELPPTDWNDENIGDHRVSIDLTISNTQNIDHEPQRIDPPTVEGEGEATRLAVDLSNTGALPGATTVTFNVTDPDTGEPVNVTTVTSELVAPGSQQLVTWDWTPSEDGVDPGFYNVQYSITDKFGEDVGGDGQPRHDTEDFTCNDDRVDCRDLGVVLVDEQPLFFEDSFENEVTLDPDDEKGWSSSNWGNPCSPVIECWELRDDLAHTGSTSTYIGVSDEQAGEGETYQENGNVELISPKVDLSPRDGLSNLGDEGLRLQNPSPFDPALGFHYRSLLGDGDQVEVDPPCGASASIGASNQDEWRDRSVSIGRGCSGTFSWVFAPDGGPQSGIGFGLDTVTVSSYRAEMQPEVVDVTVWPGAEKHLHFKIENTGAAADTFDVRVDDARTSTSAFEVDVLDDEVHLAPFETEIATVALEPAEGAPPNVAGRIVLEAVPSVDPNQAARSTIDVRLEQRDQPNLVPRVDRASGATGPVEEQDIVNFAVTVQNRGAATSDPADLVVQACPAHEEATRAEDLENCGDDAHEARFVPLADATIGELEPLREDAEAAATETVTWQVPQAEVDAYHVVAEVDPENEVAEEDTSDNLDALTLAVDPLQAPDVTVDAFRVTHRGEPVHQASEGDMLRVEGQVTNTGNIDAENVGVTILTRFPLLQEEFPTLSPGETVNVSTQWRTEAGNWVLLLEARAVGGTVEADLGDNLARWDLAVRSGGIHADASPAHLEVRPGEDATAYLTLRNARSAPANLTAEALTPEGVRLTGLPPSTALPANGVAEHRIGVHVDRDADPGPRTLAFAFRTNPDQAPVAETKLDLTIPHETDLAYATDPVTTSPGALEVPVNVTNPAPDAQRVDLDVDGPEAWTVRLSAASVEIGPDTTRALPVQVQMPTTTEPGGYRLQVLEDGDPVHTVPVSITPTPAWEARVTSTHETADGREVFVHVENTGNAEGLPPLEHQVEASSVSVDPPVTTLGAGQSQTYRIEVDGAGAGTLALAGTTVPLGGEGGNATAAGDELLHLEAIEVPARTAPAPGQTVEIHPVVEREGGSGTASVPVRLYVDGFLVDEAELALVPGQAGNATLSWTAEPGTHVFTVSAGDLDNATARTHEIDVPSQRQAPGAGPAALAAALALAAGLALRGRKRP